MAQARQPAPRRRTAAPARPGARPAAVQAAPAPRPAPPRPNPAPAARPGQAVATQPAAGLVRPGAKTAKPAKTTRLSTPTLLRRLRVATVGFQAITTLIGGFAFAQKVDKSFENLAAGPLNAFAIVVAALAVASLLVVMVIAARRTHRVLNLWLLGAMAADGVLIVELAALGDASATMVIVVLLTGVAAIALSLNGFRSRLAEYR
ncbi:MAG: hypothetical protein LBS56_07090 [Propionibacteriaceae bacterium]|jgi:hypothetical protein|nr:hypothetical protein [Propionibacteriaceae bacterium]